VLDCVIAQNGRGYGHKLLTAVRRPDLRHPPVPA
jgi:hypothetical protein